MRNQNILFLLFFVLMATNAQDKERTFFELKEVKKVDSLHDNLRMDKGPVYKEKQIIRTYHHIIKKILPPYPEDLTVEANNQQKVNGEGKEQKDLTENTSKKGDAAKSLKVKDQKAKFKRRPLLEESWKSHKNVDKKGLRSSRHKTDLYSPGKKMFITEKYNKTNFWDYLHRRKRQSNDNDVDKLLSYLQLGAKVTTMMPAQSSSELVNDRGNIIDLNRKKHGIRIYEEIKHLAKNTSRIVIQKNNSMENTPSGLTLKPNTEPTTRIFKEYIMPLFASGDKVPWYPQNLSKFNLPTEESAKYHIIWNPTKIITDYVPLSTLTKQLSTSSTPPLPTTKWYPTTVSRYFPIPVPTFKSSKTMMAETLSVPPLKISNTTDIDLDELLHLIESYLPDGELEFLTNDVKLKNEIVAFKSYQSTTAVTPRCDELAAREKKLRLFTLLLWLMSTFCLLIAVAMGFLIYISKIKDKLYMLPNTNQVKSERKDMLRNVFKYNTGVEEYVAADREKADVQILLEVVQKALNDCRFYHNTELTRMYSTVEHIKSMIGTNKM